MYGIGELLKISSNVPLVAILAPSVSLTAFVLINWAFLKVLSFT